MKNTQRAVLVPTAVIAVLLSGVLICSAQAETVSRSKYASSGISGYVYEGNSTGCGWEGTSFDFSQSLTKSGYNRSSSNSGYFYSYTYDYCNSTDKNCSGYIELDTLNVLKSNGKAQGAGTLWCSGTDSNGNWNSWSENVTIDATLTCSGDYISTSKYKDRYSYSGPWGSASYSYSSRGSYCDANATGTITSDGGMNITLGQSSSTYGQLGNWKNRTVSIETYTP